MKHKLYKEFKNRLKTLAEVSLMVSSDDLPGIRQDINIRLDELVREIDYNVMKEVITEKMGEVYKKWLTNLAISLHPEKRYKK